VVAESFRSPWSFSTRRIPRTHLALFQNTGAARPVERAAVLWSERGAVRIVHATNTVDQAGSARFVVYAESEKAIAYWAPDHSCTCSSQDVQAHAMPARIELVHLVSS